MIVERKRIERRLGALQALLPGGPSFGIASGVRPSGELGERDRADRRFDGEIVNGETIEVDHDRRVQGAQAVVRDSTGWRMPCRALRAQLAGVQLAQQMMAQVPDQIDEHRPCREPPPAVDAREGVVVVPADDRLQR